MDYNPYQKAPDVARDVRGIDQCLDRLGELRGQASMLRESLERMDQKLNGPRPVVSTPTLGAVPQAPSNVEELEQKITDLQYLLNTIRDHILSINNFINAQIY